MTHTEGPWQVVPERNFNQPRIFAGDPETETFRTLIATIAWREGEHDANARLIAAAPEMLEALHQCVIIANSAGGHGIIPGRITQIAREAIAKAEGADVNAQA